MKGPSPPRLLDIDRDRLREIVRQTRHRPLTDEEHVYLEGTVENAVWFQDALRAAKLDKQRLYRMLFGPTSEKTKVVFPEPPVVEEDASESEQAPHDDDELEKQPTDSESSTPDKDKKRKGHGRNAAAAYRGAQRCCISHESLKPGEICPVCKKGKVYELREPAVIVRITGGAPLDADIYEMQRLRCNLCGEVFTARAPRDAEKPKYDETAAAMIALLRYGAGLPHHRLDKLQRSLGIPVPASTQWDIVSQAAPSIAPVYEELIRLAAQGEVLHNDDTKMPVLALTGKRRAREAPDDDPPDRTGMFTTGIISRIEGRRIALFFTGRQHAGENLSDVLAQRATDLAPPIQMCDGLERNLPKELSTILANCNSHARRHFVDVAENFPVECRHVLDTLAKIFRHEAHCRKEQLSDDERLAFHQKHSGPIMEELKAWLEAQLEERKVEPNSGLGNAFHYVLKRWDKLTLFLRVPGAPLENNIVERALKRAIVHRKNSLFYRSLRGARVGDMFMSLIHTAELSGANPLDYLVALQQHAGAVHRAPAEWMPWNYDEARARLAAEQAA